jgi:hypothetical protein
VLKAWVLEADFITTFNIQFRYLNETQFTIHVRRNSPLNNDLDPVQDIARLHIWDESQSVIATYQPVLSDTLNYVQVGTLNLADAAQFKPVIEMDWDTIAGYTTESLNLIVKNPSGANKLTVEVRNGNTSFLYWLEVQNQAGAVIQAQGHSVGGYVFSARDWDVPGGTTQVRFRFKTSLGTALVPDTWADYTYPTAEGDTGQVYDSADYWTPSIPQSIDQTLSWNVQTFTDDTPSDGINSLSVQLSGPAQFLAGEIHLWPERGSPGGSFPFNAHALSSAGFPGSPDTWSLTNVPDGTYKIRITDGEIDAGTPPYFTGTVYELGELEVRSANGDMEDGIILALSYKFDDVNVVGGSYEACATISPPRDGVYEPEQNDWFVMADPVFGLVRYAQSSKPEFSGDYRLFSRRGSLYSSILESCWDEGGDAFNETLWRELVIHAASQSPQDVDVLVELFWNRNASEAAKSIGSKTIKSDQDTKLSFARYGHLFKDRITVNGAGDFILKGKTIEYLSPINPGVDRV